MGFLRVFTHDVQLKLCACLHAEESTIQQSAGKEKFDRVLEIDFDW